MKKNIYILILLFICCFSLKAQQRNNESQEFNTIFKGTEFKGYALLSTGYSLIDKRNAMVINARGGIVLANTISIGFAGSSFMNDYQQLNSGSNIESSLVGGYGGVYLELILFQKSPIYLSIPTVAAIGAVSYAEWDRASADDYIQTGRIKSETSFFIVEPSAEINLRLASWLIVGGYGSYRFTSPLSNWFTERNNVKPYALEGYTLGIHLKVGKF